MIKKSLNLVIVLFAIVLKQLYPQSVDSTKFSYYHIVAKEIDLNAINSFPQKIVKINSNESPFDLIINSHATNLPAKRFNSIKTLRYRKKTSYPEDINRYLKPT